MNGHNLVNNMIQINKFFKITVFLFLVTGVINIPYLNTTNAEAGVIKWGVKKVIFGSLKIIFSEAKSVAVEKAKITLVKYLKKHPEYIDYTVSSIKEHINKYPKYAQRGTVLIDNLSNIKIDY